MAYSTIKLSAVVLMVVLTYQIDVTSCKQLIRLQSGAECLEPGYFRDVTNCRKFYYCPSVSALHGGLSPEEKVELENIRRKGIECPHGSIFEETLSACQNIHLVDTIPPECKTPESNEIYSELKTGLVRELPSNAH